MITSLLPSNDSPFLRAFTLIFYYQPRIIAWKTSDGSRSGGKNWPLKRRVAAPLVITMAGNLNAKRRDSLVTFKINDEIRSKLYVDVSKIALR